MVYFGVSFLLFLCGLVINSLKFMEYILNSIVLENVYKNNILIEIFEKEYIRIVIFWGLKR